MAAVTFTSRVVTPSSTNNAASYTSGTFTPTNNDVLLAAVVLTGTVSTPPTLSDTQNLGWTLVATALKNASADVMYLFVSNSKATNVSTTVTVENFGSNASGCEIIVTSVANMNAVGASAIKQAGVQQNGAGTTVPSVTGLVSINTLNGMFGVIGCGTSSTTKATPPTSWTELSDAGGYSSPTTGMETCYRSSGASGTSITWGAAVASAYCAIVVEMDAIGAERILSDSLSQTDDETFAMSLNVSDLGDQQTQSDDIATHLVIGPEFLQSKSVAPASTDVIEITFTNNVKLGSFIFGALLADSLPQITDVSDGTNVYDIVHGVNDSGKQVWWFSAFNAVDNAALTITVTLDQVSLDCACIVHEVMYIDTVTPIDTVDSASVGLNPSISISNSTRNSDYLAGFCFSVTGISAGLSVGTNYSWVGREATSFYSSEDVIQAAAGSISVQWSSTDSGPFLAVGVGLAYKYAGSSGTVPLTKTLTDQQVQSDTYALFMSMAKTLADQQVQSDSVAAGYGAQVVDATSQADALTNALGLLKALADQQVQSDVVAQVLGLLKSLGDQQTQTDTASFFMTLAQVLSDSQSQADGAAEVLGLNVILGDQQTQQDFVDPQSAGTLLPLTLNSLADQQAQTDAASFFMTLDLELSDGQTQADGAASVLGLLKSVGDSRTQSDAFQSFVPNLWLSEQQQQNDADLQVFGDYALVANDQGLKYWADEFVFDLQDVASGALTKQLDETGQQQTDSILFQMVMSLQLADQQVQSDTAAQKLDHYLALADSQTQADATARQLEHRLVITDQQTQSDDIVPSYIDYYLQLADALTQLDDITFNFGGIQGLTLSSLAEQLTLSDSLTLFAVFSQLLADSNPQTDAVAEQLAQNLVLADSQTQSDAAVELLEHRLVVADSQTQSDNITQQLAMLLVLSDSQTQSEVITMAMTHSLNIADALSQADAIVKGYLDYYLQLSDQQTQQEDITFNFGGIQGLTLPLSDALSQADGFGLFETYNLFVSDTNTLVDDAAQNLTMQLKLADSQGQVDSTAFIADCLKTLSDSQTQSDSTTRILDLQRAIADSTSQADALNAKFDYLLTLAETSNYWSEVIQTDSGQPFKYLTLDDSLSQADDIQFMFTHALKLSDQQVQSEDSVRQLDFIRLLTDSQTQSDKLGIAYGLLPSEALSQSDTFSALHVYLQTLSDTLQQADGMFQSYQLFMRDGLTFTDTVFASAFYKLQQTLGEVSLTWLDDVYRSSAQARGPMRFTSINIVKAMEFTDIDITKATDFSSIDIKKKYEFTDIDILTEE